jgi:hypothetical protein
MTPSKETRRAEGRGQPGRNPREGGRVRTQSRAALPSNLARVNAAARAAVQTRFTALLHHVDVAALERAFRRQKRQASAGVDGITVGDYEQNLEANLQDSSRYRPGVFRRPPDRAAVEGLVRTPSTRHVWVARPLDHAIQAGSRGRNQGGACAELSQNRPCMRESDRPRPASVGLVGNTWARPCLTPPPPAALWWVEVPP